MMFNTPHLNDAQHKAMDLLSVAGDDAYQKTVILLLIEILDAMKAHDQRISKVEDGFANGDPPGHRKVHERYIEKAQLAREDFRTIRNKIIIAVSGAAALWIVQTTWPAIRAALMTNGVAH